MTMVAEFCLSLTVQKYKFLPKIQSSTQAFHPVPISTEIIKHVGKANGHPCLSPS